MNEALELKRLQYEALKLECNLMIFHRSDCACSDFWARSGNALIEQILDLCEKEKKDPLEYFCDWAAAYHNRHAEGVIYT